MGERDATGCDVPEEVFEDHLLMAMVGRAAHNREAARWAAAALFRRHAPRLLAFLRPRVRDPSELEDVVHDVFERVLRAAAEYRPEAKFKTWLYTVAVNLCRDRDKKRIGRKTLLGPREDVAAGVAVEMLKTGTDALSKPLMIRQVLERLDALDQQLVFLRFSEDMSQREAAKILGLPIHQARMKENALRDGLARSLEELAASVWPEPQPIDLRAPPLRPVPTLSADAGSLPETSG